MSYGRNFEFMVTPRSGERAGRYYNDSGAALPIGAPVKLSGNNDGLGRLGLTLADADSAAPLPGKGGIAVYEELWYKGDDPNLVTYSDKDTIPAGAPCQLVSGQTVKVAYTNTTATSFLTRTGYPTARTMVAGAGATPTVAAGDGLTVQTTPNGTNGYWVETATDAKKWLIVTSVDATTGRVEARLNF